MNKDAQLTVRGICESADSKAIRLLWLLIPIGVFVVYLQSLSFPLTNYDDFSYINSDVKSGLNAESIRFAFTSQFSYYTPVTWLSFIVESTFFPSAPAGIFRLTNIWLHIANSFLLLKLLGQLFPNSRSVVFVVLLFALHPIQVESVVWVSERKGLLAALFALLCMNDYVSFAMGGNRRLAIRAVVFYALSLLSKPSFFGLVILLPVMRRLIVKNAANQKHLRRIDLFIIGVTVIMFSLQICLQKGTLDSSGLHPLTCMGSYVLYIAKLFYPIDLIIPYQRYSWSSSQALIAAVLLVVATITFWIYRKRRPALLFGWIWFLCLLIPMSGIVSLGEHGLANRYLYLPSIGIFVISILLIDPIVSYWLRSKSTTALISWPSIALLTLLILSFREVTNWKDTETLFGRTLRLDASNSLAREILYKEALRNNNPQKAQSYSSPTAYGDPGKNYGLFHAFFPEPFTYYENHKS